MLGWWLALRGAAHRAPFSGAPGGKRQYLLDLTRPAREQEGTVESEPPPGAIGQSRLERCQQPLVGGGHGQAAAVPLGIVARETRALLGGGGELVEAVGELDAVAVQLKAQRGARIARIEPRERRLAGRIAVHERQGVAAEPRPDGASHEQLEPRVARGVRVAAKSQRLRRLLQLRNARAEWIEAELAAERLAVAQTLAGPPARDGAQQAAHQRLHLVHQRLERESGAIPLDEGELRIVQGRALEAAHHVADLVDVAAARRQQALHRVLGRGMQVVRRRVRSARERCELHAGAMDVHVADRRVHHQGRIHLEHAARGEELAGVREQRRTLHQARARGARTPVIARRARASVASACPRRTGLPGTSPVSQLPLPGGSSMMTVEPMLKRATSAPRASARGARAPSSGRTQSRRRRRAVTSPCQIVDMLPTNNAPTSTRAKLSGPAPNMQITRSLRANSPGTAAAVTPLTLNSCPGTYHAARSVPASGMCTRW